MNHNETGAIKRSITLTNDDWVFIIAALSAANGEILAKLDTNRLRDMQTRIMGALIGGDA